MLTQCPNCQTTFRVTSEILRVADGQVRCGRCHTQFNALERLIDEGAAAQVESGRFLRPPRPAQRQEELSTIEVEEPAEQEEITLEGRHIEITGTYRVLDVADGSGEHLQQQVTEEWAEIVDAEADADAAAEQVEADTDETDSETATDDEQLESDDDTATVANEDHEILARAQEMQLARVARAAAAARAAVTHAPPDPLFAPARRFPHRRRPEEKATRNEADEFALLNIKPQSEPGALKWKLLFVPLLLLLPVQAIHHYRADLARQPQIGTLLMSVYQSLHLPLTPEWNLHAYELKQWGVLSDPAAPGTLKVRASITNRAAFPQPYPLLKLVLEDRWGDQVRAREFEPAEYLDPGTATDRLLSPQQQTNATIVIVDPGPDAEGFRFDVCLRGRGAPVCAADVPDPERQ